MIRQFLVTWLIYQPEELNVEWQNHIGFLWMTDANKCIQVVQTQIFSEKTCNGWKDESTNSRCTLHWNNVGSFLLSKPPLTSVMWIWQLLIVSSDLLSNDSDTSQQTTPTDHFTSTDRVKLYLESLKQDVRREFDSQSFVVWNICPKIYTWSGREHFRNVLSQVLHRPSPFHPPKLFRVVGVCPIL